MLTLRRATGPVGALLGALAITALPACGGPTASGSGGSGGSTVTGGSGGAGGAAPTSYAPAGCQFEVAPRPEYTEFSVGKTDTAGDPKIERVRLGLGGNVTAGTPGYADPSTTIGVAWQTELGTLASEIQWGASADPATWPKENRASGATWLTPPGTVNGHGDTRMHEVYVCGLTPKTTYYYRVGGGPEGKEVWSDVTSFTTTPAPGDGPVTIAVNGDARKQNGDAWRLYQKKVRAKGASLQLFSGDTVLFGGDQAEWEQWLDLGAKDENGAPLTLGQILTLNTNGNHDNRSTMFFSNLTLPQDPKKLPAYAELFYSLDVGPVHVTVMDDSYFVMSTTPQEDIDALTAWLEADLKAANDNRANVPWIVTLHHHGPFSSSTHGKDLDVLRGRAFLMPLYDKYHVDVDVAGHDHNYERSLPVSGPADAPTIHDAAKDGTVYLLCAGAGADAYAPGVSAFTGVSAGFDKDGGLGNYGFLTADKTELWVEAFALRPDGTDPQIDSYTISK